MNLSLHQYDNYTQIPIINYKYIRITHIPNIKYKYQINKIIIYCY